MIPINLSLNCVILANSNQEEEANEDKTALKFVNLEVDAQDINGWTPLITAIVGRITQISEVTKLLLQLGANPFLASNDGKNAFHWASRIGNKEAIEAMTEVLSTDQIRELLDSQTNDEHNLKPIQLAAKHDTISVFPLLMNLEQKNREHCIHHTYPANADGTKDFTSFCDKCFAKNNIYTPDEHGRIFYC